LLSNAMIITRPARIGRKKEKYYKKIDLDHNAALEIVDELDFEIIISGEEEISHKFICSSAMIRAHWVTDIKFILEEHQLKSPRNPLFIINPREECPPGQKPAPIKSRKLRKRLSFKKMNSPKDPPRRVTIAGKKLQEDDDEESVQDGHPDKNTDKKTRTLSTGANKVLIKDQERMARSKTGQGSLRPDMTAQVAVELTQLRDEVALFREEREMWLHREAELQDRIRYLESQLYRLLSNSSPSDHDETEFSDVAKEYRQFSLNLRNLLGKLDSCVDAIQKRESVNKEKEVKS